VACLPTVVACLIIRTFSCNVALLITVVAQPQVSWRHWRSGAFPSTVSSFATGMANALIWTITGHVARFFTVPAE